MHPETRLLLSCVALSACATVTPDVQPVSGPGYEGVIFSAERARRVCGESFRVWTPTRRTVAQFERRLPAYLQMKRIALESPMTPRLRQYLGVSDYKTGRRVLRVGLLCAPEYSDAQPVIGKTDVYHDCDCMALFDPASKQILDFGCAMRSAGPGRYPRDPALPPVPQPELPSTGEPTPPAS
jgi:hypothetical protein